MSTLQVALAEIAALKARLDALEARVSGGGASSSSSGGGTDFDDEVRREQPLPDSSLDKPWADKTVISKDPKKWKGPTQVGRKYSRAPSDWLLLAAELAEFKAHMGRKENPPRLRNDGKPWHETDSFNAKLLRAWARRNEKKLGAQRPAATAKDDDPFGSAASSSTPSADFGDFSDANEDVPFAINAILFGRWDRP